MTSDNETVIRQQLIDRLRGRGAHMPLEDAIKDFPMDRINQVFPNGSYCAWALVEHIRRGQWDILDFIRNPDYKYLEWPKDYWPVPGYEATPKDWDATVAGYLQDQAELERLVLDPSTDLYARIPWGEGQTILREILLVADHTAYHTGEFAIMRQVMGTWSEGRPVI